MLLGCNYCIDCDEFLFSFISFYQLLMKYNPIINLKRHIIICYEETVCNKFIIK